MHDDVIKWKHFPHYWTFVRGIHWSPVNSQHKGQWRGGLMFSLICAWINGWVNNHEAGDLRGYHAHYDVILMHICSIRGRWVNWLIVIWYYISFWLCSISFYVGLGFKSTWLTCWEMILHFPASSPLFHNKTWQFYSRQHRCYWYSCLHDQIFNQGPHRFSKQFSKPHYIIDHTIPIVYVLKVLGIKICDH